MNNFTESTWALVPANDATRKLMKTYVDYPPRKLQSESYAGPITLTQYQRFANIREASKKEGFSLRMPAGD